MKNILAVKRVWAATALVFVCTFVIALLPPTRTVEPGAFHLGFPIPFFTLYADIAQQFSVQCNLLSLLGDLVLAYGVCSLAVWVRKRGKPSR